MVGRYVRLHLLALTLFTVAPPLAAQQPARLTADDYARAERFPARHTASLVSGQVGPVAWLSEGRFWYRVARALRQQDWLADRRAS
jgi:hypothetical protein